MADLLLEDGHREELLAAGILGILSPAVEQVDQKISEVRCVCILCLCWGLERSVMGVCGV